MIACQTCAHWIPKTDKWGTCPLANNKMYVHPKGFKCRHTQARYKGTRACKTRYEPKEDKC